MCAQGSGAGLCVLGDLRDDRMRIVTSIFFFKEAYVKCGKRLDDEGRSVQRHRLALSFIPTRYVSKEKAG